MSDNVNDYEHIARRSAGHLLLAGAVVRAAAERHADHTAGEGHEQGVMIPIQLETQHPPVLTPHVTSREQQKDQNMSQTLSAFVSYSN